jgi:hypothetical protein
MSEWAQDDRIWDKIDILLHEMWLPLKDFLDIFHEYNHELNPQTQAIMFGGVGTLVMKYCELRNNDSSHPESCLQEAIATVHNDKRVQQFMANAINIGIDTKIQQMKEDLQ